MLVISIDIRKPPNINVPGGGSTAGGDLVQSFADNYGGGGSSISSCFLLKRPIHFLRGCATLISPGIKTEFPSVTFWAWGASLPNGLKDYADSGV